jgi:hypothetical protein
MLRLGQGHEGEARRPAALVSDLGHGACMIDALHYGMTPPKAHVEGVGWIVS